MEAKAVALVTGASKGIGRYLVERLLTDGYSVVGCSRSEAPASEGYRHVIADVSREEDVLRLLRVVREDYGRLDVAVNNAGIASMNHALLTPVDTLDRMYGVHLRGAFLVSREAAKLMQRRKWGRLVNLTSIVVPLVLEGETAYASMKGAVETFTRGFAREVAASGITVNAVGPGPVDTDLLRGVPKHKMRALLDRLPIRSFGELADVWNVVRFFIDKASHQVTGQVLYLGGAS